MMQSINNVLTLLPEGATWAISLTLIFLLVGWISSIAIAARQKGLLLIAFIPLTNPLAVVALLFKQTSTGLIPFSCYALALATWLYGGNHAHKVEFERLAAYEGQLSENGEPLRASAYKQSPINPDNNVWDHPYLKTLGLAGQRNQEGDQARKEMEGLYKSWSLPKHGVSVKYETPEEDRQPFIDPVRNIHDLSIQYLQSSGEPDIKWPTTPQSSAQALEPFFSERRDDLKRLREAVTRPEDVYPHAWENGFDMLLPQLAKLKSFTQISSLSSIYHSLQGHQEESYQNARLTFQLAMTGDTDLLISRLVQFAQLQIALETIMAAQQTHLWSDEQWVEIRSFLNDYSAIKHMPNSLRLERAVGYSYIEPMFNQSWSKAMKRLGQLGGSGQMEIETGMAMNLLDTMASKFSQAFLAKQWRLCMEAYTFMIADMEQAVAASKETPWKDIQSNWADQNILNYGILAKMLIPALSNIQEKAIHIQVKLELAKVAIDLERFYLKHGSYPDSLDDLSPTYRLTPPLDPMTQKALSYRRNEGGGFEMFSVGMNGTDDGGKHIKKPKRNQTNPPDDLLWRIEKSSPLLPAFQVDA